MFFFFLKSDKIILKFKWIWKKLTNNSQDNKGKEISVGELTSTKHEIRTARHWHISEQSQRNKTEDPATDPSTHHYMAYNRTAGGKRWTFQYMVLGYLDNHEQKNKPQPIPHNIYNNWSEPKCEENNKAFRRTHRKISLWRWVGKV